MTRLSTGEVVMAGVKPPSKVGKQLNRRIRYIYAIVSWTCTMQVMYTDRAPSCKQ